jgi:hypothetical protein
MSSSVVRLPAAPTGDDALIEQLRADVADLRLRVARLEAARARRDARRDARLLAAIGDAMPREHVFDCAQLLKHAQDACPTLRRALLRAGLHTPQQLGKRLQRLQGRDLGGLRLERLGADKAGAIWTVRVIPDSHLRAGIS